MRTFDRRDAIKLMGAVTSLAAFSQAIAEAAPEQGGTAKGSASVTLSIPESIKAEHAELHQGLARAIESGGKTGEAAQAVANILDRHFGKEEQFAMPQLGLLRDVAAGRVTPDMSQAVELSEQLKKDLPQMLKEHQAIVNALDILTDAARQERKPEAVTLADNLKLHAMNEEEVLYPSSILIGEYLKLKLKK